MAWRTLGKSLVLGNVAGKDGYGSIGHIFTSRVGLGWFCVCHSSDGSSYNLFNLIASSTALFACSKVPFTLPFATNTRPS